MKLLNIMWHEVKGDLKATIIFTGLMALFFFWFVSIFDPDMFKGLEEAFASYPEGMQEMIGGQLALAKFGGFLHVYLFSMAWFYFGIYFVMKTCNDIPKEIEDKTIDLMLSKPIKRWGFSLGKYLSQVVAALILIAIVYLVVILGIFTLPNVDPNKVYFAELSVAFIWLFILLVAIISSSFLFSTFMDSKKALVFSLGILIFFYIIGAFAGLFDEDMQDIQYLSIFYYANTSELLTNNNWDNVIRDILVLSGYSIVLIVISVIIFNKRDIPI